MHYESPSKLVVLVAVFGGIPLLFLVNILGFRHLCGVSGLSKTEDGARNVTCSCVGYQEVETVDTFNNSTKMYCTGLDFSNNDLNRIIRVSQPNRVELEIYK